MTSKYRPDIDGLRAVAVGAVLLFHAKLGLPGGFVGVDVFFVISGYLITTLLLKDYGSSKGVQLLDFWERRVRRIFPAFLVVLLVTVAIGWFMLLPSAYYNLANSLLAQAAFGSNFYFWSNQGYFSNSANPEPLLHTWSLAVEEQFYILFPLLFLAIPSSNLQRLKSVVLTVAIGSFIFSLWQVKYYPDAAFFLLPSRAWELLTGALLAVFQKRDVGCRCLREIFAWCGIASIIFCCLFYSNQTPFPGLAALPPILGTVAVIWSGGHSDRKTTLEKVLSLKSMVFIGKISYSLYLWHFPVFVYATYWQDNQVLRWPIRGGLIVICFLLAIASWRWVETPFRSFQYCRSRKAMLALGATLPVVALIGGFSLQLAQGWPQRFPEIVNRIDKAPYADALNTEDSEIPLISNLENAKNGIFYEIGDVAKPLELIVWGDSHAMAIKPAMQNLAAKTNSRIQIAAHPATCPVLGYESFDKTSLLEKSQHWNNAVFQHIKTESIPNVLLVANWPWYYCNGGPENDWEYNEQTSTIFGNQLAETVQGLTQVGVKVWILARVPTQPTDFRMRLVKSLLAGQSGDVGVNRDVAFIISKQQKIVFEASLGYGAELIDPVPLFFTDRERCQLLVGQEMLFSDANHISPNGAILISEIFGNIINEK